MLLDSRTCITCRLLLHHGEIYQLILLTPQGVVNLRHHWFKLRLGTEQATRRYMNRKMTLHQTSRIHFGEYLDEVGIIDFKKDAVYNVACKISAILQDT